MISKLLIGIKKFKIVITQLIFFLWDKEKKKTIIGPLLSNSNLESIEIESGFK